MIPATNYIQLHLYLLLDIVIYENQCLYYLIRPTSSWETTRVFSSKLEMHIAVHFSIVILITNAINRVNRLKLSTTITIYCFLL